MFHRVGPVLWGWLRPRFMHPLVPSLSRIRSASGLTMHQHRQLEMDLNRLTALEAENAELRAQLEALTAPPERGRKAKETTA